MISANDTISWEILCGVANHVPTPRFVRKPAEIPRLKEDYDLDTGALPGVLILNAH